MATRSVLKNFNLFVDSKGYAGKVDEVTLPKLTLKMEEFRAGGMDAPIEIEQGMEKLEMSFVVGSREFDILKTFGVFGKETPLTLRGAFQDEMGVVTPVTINATGICKERDLGTWKPGENAPATLNFALKTYKETQDGTVLYDIDITNMKRVINGKDQLEGIRSALGMSK